MFPSLRHLIGWMMSAFCSRQDLILENLALRQQLLALHAKRPRRHLSARQELFWIVLRKLWQGWKKPLILVTPRTVVEWHRAGFRVYWKWLSKARRLGGRQPVDEQIRGLIFRMAAENPTWGAPRIHGELLKLGFKISEPTVSRWPSARAQKSRCANALADFPAKPPGGHERRHGEEVHRRNWQNGVAERWVGSCRRDLLDHVIVLNERHLKRLMREYIRYYHEDRTHLGLAKDTPQRAPRRDGLG